MHRFLNLITAPVIFGIVPLLMQTPGLWAQEKPASTPASPPAAKTATAADQIIGLVATRPETGRFVETPQGFMVPYTMKIPGTEVEFSMEPIPGGRFRWGSPESESTRKADEGPQVEITVEPFWMARTEVTWAQYREFMKLYAVFKELQIKRKRLVSETNRVDAITAPTELYDPSFTFEFGDDARLPAVTMTQYAAKQFTKWLSAVTGQVYRLPGEAEWEYACRAGSTTAYAFGDDPTALADYGWFYDNASENPQPVAGKKANAWGLYDMHGNVWEWVLDEYFEEGYERLKGKAATDAYASIAWPTRLFPRVVRGGSWDDDAAACRSAAKMGSHDIQWKSEDPNLPLSPWWFTSDPSRAVGFRFIRPLHPPAREACARFWEPDVEEIELDVQARLDEGRGALGIVDKALPAAIDELNK